VCGDVERQIAVARADERWVVVGTGVPSVVGIGWEGMASGARGRWRRPGRRRGLLRRRAIGEGVMAIEVRVDEDALRAGVNVDGPPPGRGVYLPMKEEVGRGGVEEDDVISVDGGDGVVFLFADGGEEWAVIVERRDASWTVSSCAISARMASRGAAQASFASLIRRKAGFMSLMKRSVHSLTSRRVFSSSRRRESFISSWSCRIISCVASSQCVVQEEKEARAGGGTVGVGSEDRRSTRMSSWTRFIASMTSSKTVCDGDVAAHVDDVV
jgi:hypothetical protein